jgi:putative SOS response-associated peptidase YedK
MFRTAFKRSRSIVPASGYYEWKTINDTKQPFYFSAADGGVLSIAGLWDEWNDRTSPAGPPLLHTDRDRSQQVRRPCSRPHAGVS